MKQDNGVSMLPKINESLKFETKVPSTRETFKYRPYLVKEEKVLLQAFESGDLKMTVKAMIDTVDACCVEPLKTGIRELATFDLEYLFAQIRSKSVGEMSEIVVKCGHCEELNPYEIDLTQIEVDFPDTESKIPLTDDIFIEMQYPRYETVLKDGFDLEQSEAGITMELVASCMKNVLTDEERIDCSTISAEEKMSFIESMTSAQFIKVSEFVKNMPSLSKKIEFRCTKCGKEDGLELRGLSDFF